MRRLQMRDVSRAGHELGGAEVTGLPARCTLDELLAARVRQDVATYEAAPGTVFRGLVQPRDAVRHSDGHHLPTPRPLDAAAMHAAAREAVTAGILSLRVDGARVDDLDAQIDVAAHEEVTVVLQRSVVARDA